MSRAALLNKAAGLGGGKDPLAKGALTRDLRGGGCGAPTLGGATSHTAHTTHRRDGAGRQGLLEVDSHTTQGRGRQGLLEVDSQGRVEVAPHSRGSRGALLQTERDAAARAERGGAASAGSLLRGEAPRSAPTATKAPTAPPPQRERGMPRGQDRGGRGGDGQGKPTGPQGRAHGQEREGDNQRTGRKYGEDRERRARVDPAELLEGGDNQRKVDSGDQPVHNRGSGWSGHQPVGGKGSRGSGGGYVQGLGRSGAPGGGGSGGGGGGGSGGGAGSGASVAALRARMKGGGGGAGGGGTASAAGGRRPATAEAVEAEPVIYSAAVSDLQARLRGLS